MFFVRLNYILINKIDKTKSYKCEPIVTQGKEKVPQRGTNQFVMVEQNYFFS